MTQPTKNHLARFAKTAPPLDANWNDAVWQHAEILEIKKFRPESSAHRPRTSAKLLHAENGLHGIFRVEDQFVRSVRTSFQDEVWKDSCVEFFAQPKSGHGYFNFEMNCGGALVCCFISDPTRTSEGFKKFLKLPKAIGETIQIHSSLPKIVEPEISEPISWELNFFIPFAVFENYVGPLGKISGQSWRGNFFKCAEENSHPHWAAWSPVDEFNFHLPRCFGAIQFE